MLLSANTTLRRPRLTAFLASLLTAAAFLLPFVLRRGGVLYISNDQISQLIPFTQHIVESLQNGSWRYDFALDLGSGFIEGYTWYNLGSVFNLPLLFFPSSLVPYLIGPLLMLKFASSGLFAYLYLRLFTQTDAGALLGSLLYTFCGVAITNMVFPFEDAYALFPLLLFALELALRGRARGLFALSVALCIVVSPPFFYATVLFLALYFILRLAYKGFKLTGPLFGRLAAESVTGVLLSGFILLPSVISLMNNPRLDAPLRFGLKWLVYVAAVYFETLRALLLPPEVMHANAFMNLVDAASPELYLPLFGLVPVFAFMLAKKRHWAKGVLAASLVMLLVPVLNHAFNGFNNTYYTRWLYMPLLIAALATVLWLEAGCPGLKKGYLLYGSLALAFMGCMLLWKYAYGYGYIINYRPAFVLQMALAVAGLAITAFSQRLWKRAPRLLICGVMAFAIATGGGNILFNQAVTSEGGVDLGTLPEYTFKAPAAADLPEGAYRIYIDYDMNVASQLFGKSSPKSFITTTSAGVFEFQQAFGRYRTSGSNIYYDEPGLWALLGVEYILTTEPGSVDLPNIELYKKSAPYTIYRNQDALPMVLGFTTCIDETTLEAYGNTEKSIALLHGLALSTDAATELALTQVDPAGLAYTEGVAARQALAATSVELGNAELTATGSMEEAGALLISLPYDTGWRCWVNGEEVTLLSADLGLMAVACPAGEYTLAMTYRAPGSSFGNTMTIVGILALAVLVAFPRFKKKSK